VKELASRSEKFLQEFCALPSQNAATNLNPMIKGGVVQNMHGGMHRSGFGVFGTVHQGSDAGVDHGSRAHGARFDGHKQVAVSQTVIAEGGSGLAQSDDFSVSRWIRVGQVAIESAADDFTFMNDDGPYRDFAHIERSLRSSQGLLHPQFVAFKTAAVWHDQYCMRLVEPKPSALAQTD